MEKSIARNEGLSRRSFLKGAGIGAAGLLGATALGACASGASASTAEGSWDQETDVVVVGTGAAGVAAAMEALEAGSQVVIIEKQKAAGGITSVCEQYCAYDSKLHLPQNFDDVSDSAEIMLEDALRVSGGTADEALAKIYCNGSAEALDWMIDHGCEFKDALRVSDGRHGQGKYIAATAGELTQKLLPAIEAAGGAILTEMPLAELVRDEGGRVTGVTCADKKSTRIKARKGVVLCTGPWSDDEVLIPRHMRAVPEMVSTCAETLAAFGMPYGPYTGEAIRAAQRSGAAVRHMEYVMFDPYYSVPEVMSNKVAPAGVTRAVNQILLTPEGTRFTDEGQSRSAIALDVIDLPGNVYYPVIDGRHIPDRTGSTKFPAEKLDGFVEAGYMAKSDTLEGLAAEMERTFGIPQDATLATIQRYNGFCETGVDEEFGKDPHHMTPIDQPPFYAGPAETCRDMYTHGGLETNAEARVVDLEGAVIPGLYAAGMCTGGPLGAATISGNWQMSSIVFGRIAGKNVAAESADA
ncbi:FAD-dependent oxidoreductase [Arabiibacter massiliensis]|uniref:FAD-dependent oxidoreductase n=1 Tax=Arabiibacter massiliensis TaxID=1870985 RepID=UPI00155A9AD5|nr:FAD-dependent oxidoreductase [Arabiibacter massiliensis]